MCQTIEEEKKEARGILEAETRMIFDWKTRTMNLAKRRATDLKGNSRVFFPRKVLSLKGGVSIGELEEHLDDHV